MSRTPSQLDAEILDRLLAAGRSGAPAPAGDDGAVDYDWSVPRHFTNDQSARLEEFVRTLTGKLAEAIGGLFQSQAEVKPCGAEEHYLSGLRAEYAQAGGGYSLPLSDAGGAACGAVVLGEAATWSYLGRLLGGGSSTPPEGREMSALERSLVQDVFVALAGALGGALGEMGGEAPTAGEVARGVSLGEGEEEYWRVRFQEGGGDGPPNITFLLRSEMLDAVVGSGQGAAAGAADERRKRLEEHLGQITVPVEVRLGTVRVPTRDLMALEPGDVLVLDNTPATPVRVLVGGQPVAAGQPVVCGKCYAVRLTATVGQRPKAGKGA